MAEQTREEWLAGRKLGIGGSDLRDLFQLEGEGCRRRLWYDKSGTPADFEELELPIFRRGRALEEPAAREYEIRTGRTVSQMPEPLVYGWARVNIDRDVFDPLENAAFPLEIKTAGAFAFSRIKREGMKPAHILQLQHAVWLHSAPLGAFAVLQPDSWEMVHFDVMRDQEIIDAIKAKGDAFWPTIKVGPVPPRLYEAGEKPCRSCPWRRLCQGAEAALVDGIDRDGIDRPQLPHDEAFADMIDDYHSALALEADAKATVDLVGDAIKAKLGAREGVECSTGRIYFREQIASVIDGAGLRAKYPEIATEVSKPRKSRPLKVYAVKPEQRGD